MELPNHLACFGPVILAGARFVVTGGELSRHKRNLTSSDDKFSRVVLHEVPGHSPRPDNGRFRSPSHGRQGPPPPLGPLSPLSRVLGVDDATCPSGPWFHQSLAPVCVGAGVDLAWSRPAAEMATTATNNSILCRSYRLSTSIWLNKALRCRRRVAPIRQP